MRPRSYGLMAVAAVASVWIGTPNSAFADTISLQCKIISSVNGNFSNESVWLILDLEGHVAVDGYGDSAAHRGFDESTSTLTEESDRLTWTHTSRAWIVDYILNRSTLELLASARGINIAGETNSGNVTYACSKVQKQI
jgi:hypothetical protein